MPSYWEKRKARELYENLIPVEEKAEQLRRAYYKAAKEVEQEANKILKRFQLDHNLSEAEARRLLKQMRSAEDIDHLLQLLRQDPANAELADQLSSEAYAARLRRLQDVQDKMNILVMGMAPMLQTSFEETLNVVARRTFAQDLLTFQEAYGRGFTLPNLDPRRVDTILSRRWSGMNFSERIWANTEKLAESVKEELTVGILSGKSRQQMANSIQDAFGSASHQTRRLIRTEGTYVSTQMDLETFRAMGVEKYRYSAILDWRTSAICRDLDGEEFYLDEAMEGENLPPMHPWCRSFITPVLPKSIEDALKVRAYDESGQQVIRTLTEDNEARRRLAEILGGK